MHVTWEDKVHAEIKVSQKAPIQTMVSHHLSGSNSVTDQILNMTQNNYLTRGGNKLLKMQI